MTATAELALAEPEIDDKEYEVVNGIKEAKMAGASQCGAVWLSLRPARNFRFTRETLSLHSALAEKHL